ncbi:glycoprotein [Piry virus]|uniref:Glycoprotein n=2 Tax=Piry virus TaxID=11274 RepID=GLYCO_PIRYV|nr:glycoprotein [Piry virus]Q85213.1 RecName: Full=Glycoprotein; Flags: Precursor [Piry virus]AMR98950.1 glycoprotein [Piry virus]BAA05163.1 G protein [Piry virus]
MDLFPILVVVLMTDTVLGKFQIVFPDQNELEWRPVVGDSRHCPQSSEMQFDGSRSQTILTGKAPVGITPSKSDGFICHAAKWVTTCDFRWYGPKYITHSIHHLRPTTSDCETALQRYKDGSLINLGFPPESCGYATVTDSEAMLVQVTPHHVGVDDYRGHWIDPLFPGGECSTNFCDTVHNSSVWIPKSQKTDICAQSFKNIKMTASYPSEGALVSDRFAFHSAYHPNMPGSTVCIMDFCEQKGLRFTNGEWMGLNVEQSIREKKISAIFPNCVAGTEIRATLESEGARTLTWETQRMLDYSLCQNTWDKVSRKEPLSPLDLSYLSPRAPGKGMAYTVINGTLHSAHAKYIRTWIDYGEMKEIKGGRGEYSKAPELLWSQWFDFGPFKIGPNGLLHTGKTFKFPLYLIGAGIIDEDLHELDEAAPIDHPQMPDAKSVLPEDEEIFFGDTGVSKNPIELIQGWFSNWRESVMAIVGIVLLIVVTFLAIKTVRVLNCLWRPRKKRIVRQEVDVESRLNHFEMRGFPEYVKR